MHNSWNIAAIVMKKPDLEMILKGDSDRTPFTKVQVFGGGEMLTFRYWIDHSMDKMLQLWHSITFQGQMIYSMSRQFQDAYILSFESYNGDSCISIDLSGEIGEKVSKMSLLDQFEMVPFSHGNRNNILDFDFYHPMPL